MKLVSVETESGPLRIWDIISKVGLNGRNSLIDVKFCQYMLYKVNRRLLLSDVIGVWGPKSKAALSGWEKGGKGLVRDGIIDVIPPGGNGRGSISNKYYKLVNMQAFYISDMLGIEVKYSLVFSEATQAIILAMPDDCTDMPADLRHNMISARDAIFTGS